MTEIKYQVLDLEELRTCLHGYNDELPLEVGDIPCYNALPYGMSKENKNHYYFIATVKAPAKNNKRKKSNRIIGMLELEESPYNNNIIWLDFISVEKNFRNQGIAKKLSEMMCIFLEENKFVLERSTPTEDGLKYIKNVIDNLVDKYKINTLKKPIL